MPSCECLEPAQLCQGWGNGTCNPDFNTEYCLWDGGDCCLDVSTCKEAKDAPKTLGKYFGKYNEHIWYI